MCETARSVHVVTPDWILDCVEAMSRVDELRYHPRLILTEDELAQRQMTTAPRTVCQQSLPQQINVTEQSAPVSVISDTSVGARPSYAVTTAVEKTVFTSVPVSAVPTVLVSTEQHAYARTHLKSIGNEYVKTEACQSPLKHFASTKVSMGFSYCFCGVPSS